MTLTDRAKEILRARTFAHVAAVDEDGRPHTSPVWVDVDGDKIVINTAQRRVKARLLQEGAPVALTALDPESPYRYVGVRGRVAERSYDGADAVIDRLAQKYTGADFAGHAEGIKRITVLIEPEQVWVYG